MKLKLGQKSYSILLGTGMFLLLLFHYLDNYSHPESLIPFPYEVSYNLPLNYKDIESANILVIGDRMGIKLEAISKLFTKEASITLTKELTLFNWSEENEPIYRTIAKLKKLKKLPSIIIYHGGSSELYEQHFDIKDQKLIINNFDIFEDELLSSVMITIPFLSRLIYGRPKIFKINANTPAKMNDNILASHEKQIQIELKYKLFELELDQLAKSVQERNSELIIISTPINYLEPPKIVCANSTSPTIEGHIQKINQLFNKGDYKSAYVIASKLAQEAVGNSNIMFWYGKLLKYSGKNRTALKMLKAGVALDCSSWRGSPIFNIIMSQIAIKHDIKFINFDKIVHRNYWSNNLFIDELYPEKIYYEELASVISKQINEILKMR